MLIRLGKVRNGLRKGEQKLGKLYSDIQTTHLQGEECSYQLNNMQIKLSVQVMSSSVRGQPLWVDMEWENGVVLGSDVAQLTERFRSSELRLRSSVIDPPRLRQRSAQGPVRPGEPCLFGENLGKLQGLRGPTWQLVIFNPICLPFRCGAQSPAFRLIPSHLGAFPLGIYPIPSHHLSSSSCSGSYSFHSPSPALSVLPSTSVIVHPSNKQNLNQQNQIQAANCLCPSGPFPSHQQQAPTTASRHFLTSRRVLATRSAAQPSQDVRHESTAPGCCPRRARPLHQVHRQEVYSWYAS